MRLLWCVCVLQRCWGVTCAGLTLQRGDGKDHDFLIDREDLLRYGNHALTYRIVDRIFSQSPRRFVSGVEGKMGYEDFCWFILVRPRHPLFPRNRFDRRAHRCSACGALDETSPLVVEPAKRRPSRLRELA